MAENRGNVPMILKISIQTRAHCQICYCMFGESEAVTPRLLQCGHTFCHNCLCKWKKDSVIECPLDRELTPVMHNNVSSLKKNYALTDVFSDGKQDDIEIDLGDSTVALYEETSDSREQENDQNASADGSCCNPVGYHQSRATHAVALMLLMGNLFFDWFVKNHVDRLVSVLALGDDWKSSAIVPSVKKVHVISLDWGAIQIAYLVFAIFSTVFFGLQFFGTMFKWCFSTNDKMRLQKLFVWTNLFLNDLPQCILTVILSYATDDTFIPYLASTGLGVLGQYMIFYSLRSTEAFHYPKIIYFHALLTGICFVIQVAFISKAHIL